MREIRHIIARERFGPDIKLRVAVENEGYGMDLVEEDINPETDLLYDFEGIAIVVDQTSAVQLTNVQIDFKSQGGAKGFVFAKRS